MNRDQELLAEEEVDVLCAEAVLALLKVDPVQDHVQIVAVRFNFRMVDLHERVFDGELVEVKDLRQDAGLVRRRSAQVDPDPDAAVRPEPLSLDAVDGFSDASLASVNGEQRCGF